MSNGRPFTPAQRDAIINELYEPAPRAAVDLLRRLRETEQALSRDDLDEHQRDMLYGAMAALRWALMLPHPAPPAWAAQTSVPSAASGN